MAGLLGDIYSAGDTLKRRLRGLLADPAGTIGMGVERFGEDQRGLLNLMSNAHPMAGDRTVLNSPEQIAQFRGQLADKGTEQAMAGMFVGPNSKTWDAISAKKAEQMAAQGVDPRKVWSDTGTWKGPDGAWRQEIPDNMAKSRDYQLTPAKAFQQARFNAAIEDTQPLRDRAESMLPYFAKSKNQLTDEFSRTGGAIVDAALSGDSALAMKLQQDRGGLSAILEEMAGAKHGPASSFLKHGELGQAYPDVYKMHTRIDPDELGSSLGQYMRESPYQGEQVILRSKPVFSDAKSTQLHEMQHAIQQREGWARGGSPDDVARTAQREIDSLENHPDYIAGKTALDDVWDAAFNKGTLSDQQAIAAEKQILENYPAFSQWREQSKLVSDPLDAYRRLAGEAEARATQARIPLDAAQRRALFPEDSYDVPMNQLILRGMMGN